MEAYLHGVSTRKVDDLVKALGADTGISKSEVSRICADLDERSRRVPGPAAAATGYPYVFLDATYCKARVNHRVVSQAVVVAFGVAADGRREVLGFDVGDSENEAFWTEFLRSLKARGLDGVRLVISDAHAGLKPRSVRCCRARPGSAAGSTSCATCLDPVPKSSQEMVASIIRTVFAQPDAGARHRPARRGRHDAAPQSHPKVAAMLDDAREDVTRVRRHSRPRIGGRSGPRIRWSG